MRISVVIPAYNRADLLPYAVDSVLRQTAPVHEVIVVDDGSTDNTCEVAERYPNPVRCIRQANQGEAGARTTGMLAATGDWVAFLDSDDVWMPQKLEFQLLALDRHPEAGACYCEDHAPDPEAMLTEQPRILPPEPKEQLFCRLLERSLVGISTLMVRTDLAVTNGAFDSALRWGTDWDWVIRLSLRTPFVMVDHQLVYYRIHAGAITQNVEVRVNHGIRALRKIYAMPEAKPYERNLPRKIAEIMMDAGIDRFYAGDHQIARRLLIRSIGVIPHSRTAWSYLSKSLIPASILNWRRRRRDA